jgi:hypothetical protein
VNKRFSFLSLIGVTALLLAALGAASALAAPSGVVGTIAMDTSWSDLSKTVKITVTDSDVNVPVLQKAEVAGRGGTAAYTFAATSPITVYPNTAPIADWAGIVEDATLSTPVTDLTAITAAINALGGTYTGTMTNALVLAAAGAADVDALNSAREANGLSTNDVIVVGDPADNLVGLSVVDIGMNTVTISKTSGTGDFALVYFGSEANTTTVTLKSTSDQTGFSVTLAETGLNTGVFTDTFTLATASNASSNPQVIAAGDGNVISAVYKDASEGGESRTATLNVELTSPEATGLTPVKATETNSVTTVLAGDVTDAQSGVKSTTIKFYISLNEGTTWKEIKNDALTSDDSAQGFVNGEYTLTTITGGKSASVQVDLTAAGDGDYEWYMEAKDDAGNTGKSDVDTTTAAEGAADPHTFTLDRAAVTLSSTDPNVILGQYWDASKSGSARLITDVTKGKTTSIRVIFDGAIDGDSVAAADFTVDGVAAVAADWHSGQTDSVFLTVGAKGPSATPKVEVAAGSIEDAAGNANTAVLTNSAAADGLAPTFTATITAEGTGVPVSDDEITIQVEANETLLTNPVITVGAASGSSTLILSTAAAPAGGMVDSGSLTFLGTNQWSKTIDVDAWLTARGLDDGAFVIKVTGTDTAGNAGSGGGNDPASSSAIMIEMDDSIPAPSVTPANGTDVTRNDPFVTINWTGEASEYDGDTHKAVTLTVLTLDDADVLGTEATTDNQTFILSTSGLALGDHDLEINGTDDAGNTLASNASVTFTVKATPDVSIPLKPGMNLISLPGEPADSAINSVITVSEVKSVTSYQNGAWLSATRDADGTLSGTLSTVDGSYAYWVNTTSFSPIKVSVPGQGFDAPPPAINLSAGWNMVPITVLGSQSPGDTVSADTYFGSTSWVTAYTYDTQAGTWTKVLPNNFATVTVGAGYWVYVTAAGILVS